MTIKKQIQAKFEQYREKPPAQAGFLGRPDGTVRVANKAHWLYVTLLDGSTIQAFNRGNVPANYQLAVTVTFEHQTYYVEARQVYGERYYTGIPDGIETELQWPNTHTLYSRPEQLLPGLVYPKTGLIVYFYGGIVPLAAGGYVEAAGQEIDLTSYLPVTGATWGVIAIESNGTLSVTTGGAALTWSALLLADIPGTTGYAVAAIRLYNGQTSIQHGKFGSMIVDLRGWVRAGTGGVAPVVPSVTDNIVVFSDTDGGQKDGGETIVKRWTDIYRFGFVAAYDGTQQTTIAFDGTNTFTLAPTGTTWEYYRNGIRYTITGSKTVTLSGSPPAAKGIYYIYIDSTDGSLICDTGGWNLEDTKVPVASIVWDNALTPKYWLANERHTCAISRRYHWEHHFSDGTEIVTGPVLSGYTVSPSSPADANNTFAISQSVLSDEDLKIVLSALSDPNGTNADYVVDFRTAASTWNWESSAMPYRYTAAGYIQYDNAGTMTQGQNNKFYVTFLLLTNRQGAGRFSIVHGQAEYSTLSAAQAATFTGLTKTGISIVEYTACYMLIWETSAAYGTKGKARLAIAPISISVSASGAAAPGSVSWGSIVGTLSSQTDLQNALDAKQALDSDLTAIAGLSPSNDDIIQRKSGAWTNRTVAQYGADLFAPDFRRGGRLFWVSSSSIKIGQLQWMVNGELLTISSETTISSISAVADIYHIYLYNNAGTPTLEISTTDPVAAASWGSAHYKTGDSTKRYVGSVMSTSGAGVLKFVHYPQPDLMLYQVELYSNSLRIINAGTATTLTAVSVTGVAPPTAIGVVIAAVNSTAATERTGFFTSGGGQIILFGVGSFAFATLSVESGNIYYKCISGGILYGDLNGYYFER